MSKITPKRQAFIDAAISAGYTSPLNRADVMQIVDDFGDSHGFSWPSWITADKARRLDRGVFDVPELNGGEAPVKAAEVIPDVVAHATQAPVAVAAPVAEVRSGPLAEVCSGPGVLTLSGAARPRPGGGGHALVCLQIYDIHMNF